jgi:hypothetical protein
MKDVKIFEIITYSDQLGGTHGPLCMAESDSFKEIYAWWAEGNFHGEIKHTPTGSRLQIFDRTGRKGPKTIWVDENGEECKNPIDI